MRTAATVAVIDRGAGMSGRGTWSWALDVCRCALAAAAAFGASGVAVRPPTRLRRDATDPPGRAAASCHFVALRQRGAETIVAPDPLHTPGSWDSERGGILRLCNRCGRRQNRPRLGGHHAQRHKQARRRSVAMAAGTAIIPALAAAKAGFVWANGPTAVKIHSLLKVSVHSRRRSGCRAQQHCRHA